MATIEFNINDAFAVKIDSRVRYQRIESGTKYGCFIFDMYFKRINNVSDRLGDKATFTVTLDGTTAYFTGNEYVGIPNDNSFHKVGTAAFTYINMSAARNANATFRGSSTYADFDFEETRSVSISKGPSTDYTASTFTLSSDEVYLGEDITININKSSDAHNHKIRFYFGDIQEGYEYFKYKNILNNWVDLQNDDNDIFAGNGNTAILKFNLPESLAEHLKSKNADKCIIELTTWLDYLGTKTKSWYKTVKVKIPEKYKPKIDTHGVSFLNNNSAVDNWGICLQGYSKASAQFAASHFTSGDTAPLQYKIECSGIKTVFSSTMSDSGVLPRSGNIPFNFTVTDTRGRQATVTDYLNVVPYSPPAVGIKELYRKTSANSEGVDTGGSFLHVKAVSNYSSCDNHNSVTMKVFWKEIPNGSFQQNGTVISNGTDNNISAQLEKTKSYVIKITVVDLLGNTDEIEDGVTNYKILMHFLMGGQALGIGMYNYQNDTLKIGYDLYLKETKIDDYVKNLFSDYIVERGTATSNCINYSNNDINLGQITWQYEKYKSGKTELYGTLPQITVTNEVNRRYTYIESTSPKANNRDVIPSGGMLILNGSADSLCSIGKGNTTGRNSSNFLFLLSKEANYTSVTVKMEFRITYIPTES